MILTPKELRVYGRRQTANRHVKSSVARALSEKSTGCYGNTMTLPWFGSVTGQGKWLEEVISKLSWRKIAEPDYGGSCGCLAAGGNLSPDSNFKILWFLLSSPEPEIMTQMERILGNGLIPLCSEQTKASKLHSAGSWAPWTGPHE